MPSVRRRRRGRRAAGGAAVSVGGGEIVLVVIDFSVVVLDRAVVRAEPAAHGLEGAVGAEPLAADHAALQVSAFLGVAAAALPFFEQGHRRKITAPGGVRYNPAALPYGGV